MAQKCRNIDAINLKSYSLSENDKIMLMYSSECGLIRGVAKGCKKTKSKLGGRMDLLMANCVMISSGRNLNTICEARSINAFKGSRESIENLMFSSYVSEVVGAFGVENDPCSEEVYELLYGTLETISSGCESKVEIVVVVLKFLLKFLHVAGLAIELNTCLCCGNRLGDEELFFSPMRGGVLCKECLGVEDVSVKLHYKLRDFLVALEGTDFDKRCEYEAVATERVCMACFDMLRKYVQLHCGKAIKSVELIASTCN